MNTVELTPEQTSELRAQVERTHARLREQEGWRIHVMLRGGPLDGVAVVASDSRWQTDSWGFCISTPRGTVTAFYAGGGAIRNFKGSQLFTYGQ